MDAGSVEAWSNMSAPLRVQFYKDGHSWAGHELAARMDQVIQQEIDRRTSISMKGTGKFFDSPDLAEKYQKKPRQLESIRKNARSMWCEHRGCTLYEDMNYESGFSQDETFQQKRSMVLSTEGKMRAQTKAKSIAKKRPAAAIADGTAEAGASGEESKGNLDQQQQQKTRRVNEQSQKVRE